MNVLTVNVGSSSVKLRLLRDERVTRSADLQVSHEDELSETATHVIATTAQWPEPDVAVHRIVHGGARFHHATVVDGDTEQALRELRSLAPAHQERALAVLTGLRARHPGTVHVAAFDTAFHRTIPAAATTMAVPTRWRDWGVRRYGFHGLSHSYASRRTLDLMGRHHGRVVVAHLGSGCSLAATVDGRSVETTMGFTPLDGLVMATRSGGVDPGLIPWLDQHHGVSSGAALSALENESGLLALGGTSDIRQLLDRSREGPEPAQAQLALDVFTHRLVLGVGAMAAAAGGMDALVFTGGVGENSSAIRAATVLRLRHLGVVIDPRRNVAADRSDQDGDVAWGSSSCRVFVVHAREDLEMARQAALVMRSGAPSEGVQEVATPRV